MTPSNSDRITVGQLAAEWRERLRRGERPELSEYTARYPELADEIRELFPAVVMIEELKGDAGDLTGSQSAGPTPAEDTRLERLGDFRILREVGRGGMGVVYEAEQESLGRRVALKVLPAGSLLEPKQHKRFQREAKAAARLHHTNIVPVYGVGEHEGTYYYVMQFIQGLGLDEVLAELKRLRQAKSIPPAQPATTAAQPVPGRAQDLSAVEVAQALLTGEFTASGGRQPPGGRPPLDDSPDRGADAPRSPVAPLSGVVLPGQPGPAPLSHSGRHYWQSVARIGIQVAEALDYASGQGILHRDIKPSNLLLDTQGNVWVTDFGLAKVKVEADNLTHTGEIVGTLRYIPPERFTGQSDVRGDLYSLGLTLYELLTLRAAFEQEDRYKLIEQILHDDPPRPRRLDPAIPRDLETIVLKATARDPAHRYPRAAELAADLQRFVEDRPIRARRVSLRERFGRWCRRNPLLAAATGLAAVALVAVATISALFARAQAESARQQLLANQELARQQAQTQAEKERAEAALAKSERLAGELSSALKQVRTSSALMAVEKGQALIEQAELRRGLLWLARGLELAPPDALSLQQSIRMNLAAVRGDVAVPRAISHRAAFRVTDVAFSPDGKTFLTGARNVQTRKDEVRRWDAATGQPLGEALPHQGTAISVAFSPDGRTILTGSSDFNSRKSEARRWDAATGQPLGEPMPMDGSMRRVAFSPDGQTILTAGVSIILWDLPSDRLRPPLLPHSSKISAVAMSHDGKTIFTVCSQEVRRWDAATGQPVGDPWQAQGPVTAAAVSLDGRMCVTAHGREARRWDTATGQPVGEPLPHRFDIEAVAFSADGQTILTGSREGGFRSRKGDHPAARRWLDEVAEPRPDDRPESFWANLETRLLRREAEELLRGKAADEKK